MNLLKFREPSVSTHCKGKVKVKLSPYRPWRPLVLQEVEAPTFSLDNRLTDGGEAVSLTCRLVFTPRKILVLISVRG
jgi:hypothetical protein